MESKRWIQGAVLTLAVAAMLMTGCKNKQADDVPGDPPPKEKVSLADDLFGPYADSGKVTGNKQASIDNMNFNSLAVNTSKVVVLEKIMPKQVSANEEFTYTINVFNTADYTVNDVVVTEHPASNFTFSSASPAPTSGSNPMVWNIPKIGPKDHVTIKINGMPTGEGSLKTCATVTYVPRVCVATNVVSPALELDKVYGVTGTGTGRDVPFGDNIAALVCDPITVVYTVSNPGSGTLTNVKVSDTLPAGMTTMDGSSTVAFTVDSLAPGQERKFQTKLKTTRSGNFSSMASATSGRLKATDGAAVTTTQPVLAISKDGLKQQWAGRNIRYAISIRNTGNAPANDLTVTDALDANSTFVSATDGGVLAGNQVTWNLGSLAAGASKTVFVTVKPTIKGTVKNTATATAYCADAVSAEAQTTISGIPAILLEVIDVEDPIEVGDVVTYVITATNQGSAEDTNILITATLEEQMQYTADAGPTDGVLNGNVITFAPLPRLGVGEKATWRVTVKALAPRDVRFAVTMDSDQLTREVMETEATNFYVTPADQ